MADERLPKIEVKSLLELEKMGFVKLELHAAFPETYDFSPLFIAIQKTMLNQIKKGEDKHDIVAPMSKLKLLWQLVTLLKIDEFSYKLMSQDNLPGKD